MNKVGRRGAGVGDGSKSVCKETKHLILWLMCKHVMKR